MDKYEQYEREQKRKQTQSAQEQLSDVVFYITVAALYVGGIFVFVAAALAAIYGLVRFVKWAWYQ